MSFSQKNNFLQNDLLEILYISYALFSWESGFERKVCGKLCCLERDGWWEKKKKFIKVCEWCNRYSWWNIFLMNEIIIKINLKLNIINVFGIIDKLLF